MKRGSTLLACGVFVGMGLIVGMVAMAQRADVKPQPGLFGQGGGAPAGNVVQGFTELVTVSKAGDAVWLYSPQTGHWHKQAIPANQGQVRPVVGMGIVAFRTRSIVYACSSLTGAWDSVEIGDLPGQPVVGRNMAAFRAGNKLYGFSAETGAWDAIELAEGDAGHPTVGFVAVLETGSRVYAYSPKTGHWAVVDREPAENAAGK
jgi:hypothetical protein